MGALGYPGVGNGNGGWDDSVDMRLLELEKKGMKELSDSLYI